jgi:hypothetical protein
MADNVDITAGTGTTIHADEYTHTTLGAGKTQLVKLADGTLDAEAAIAADIGVKANALRVAPANDITDGTYIGDIKFAEALPAGTAAIGKLAANSGVDIGDVDVTSVPAPLNVVGGGTEAAALRVTVANDSTGVVTVDGTVTANLSATDNAVLDAIAASVASADGKITACNTGAVVLAAGANAIGKLAANSGVDIGDVDVTSMPADTTSTGTITAAAQTVAITIPNGCSAVSLQVTGTWVGQLEFEGTVDGTNYQSVEASNGTQTVNATTTNDIFVLPGAGYDTLRVRASSWTSGTANITFIGTIGTAASILTGSLPAGANAIGKLAANSGVDIGDVDVTSCANTSGDVAHDTGDSGNPIKVGGKAVSFDGTVPGTAVAEADRTNFITDLYGRQYVETAHPRYFNARADYGAAQTNATVQAAAGAGLKLYITDIMISNGATAGNITLLDGSGGTVIWEIYTAINGGCVANFKTPIVLTANTLLAITSTTVTTHSIAVQGYIAP